MARSQKPRKKYDPNKRMNRMVATMDFAVQQLPMRADAQRDIEIAAHIALERLINGGDKDSLYILATAFDVTHELALKGCGEDYLPEIKRGMAAIVRTKKAANLTGVWRLDAADVDAVKAALEVHDAQLETASRALVVKVMNEVMARVEGGSNETEFEAMLLEAA